MDLDDSRPIWVQLANDFRHRIVSGQWPPGSKVPSVRELAASSGVNPNTVQRALGALDSEGRTPISTPSPPSAWTWTRPRRS